MLIGVIIISITVFGAGVIAGYILCLQHHEKELKFYKDYRHYGFPEGAIVEHKELNKEIDKLI